MAPTPARGSQKPERTRQGSSIHPPQPSSSSSYHPYMRRAPAGESSSGTPFIHPALLASVGFPNSASSSSSSSNNTTTSGPNQRGRKPFNHRNLFTKDLRNLMYAFGDTANPNPESVSLLEEMTVEFITDLCCRARPSPFALGLGTSAISTASSAIGSNLDNNNNNNNTQDGNTFQTNTAATTTSTSTSSIPIDALTLLPRAPHRLRVKLEDFRHALRKDVEAKKLGRMEQLLYADKVVTEARKVGGVEDVAEKAGALQSDALPSSQSIVPSTTSASDRRVDPSSDFDSRLVNNQDDQNLFKSQSKSSSSKSTTTTTTTTTTGIKSFNKPFKPTSSLSKKPM